METPTNNTTHLPEAIVTKILARLTLRNISRFKTVCKTWKSAIESVYFRRLFVSLHQNTSSSWSLIGEGFMGKELMGFHGCNTWDLPKSLASYTPHFHDLPTYAFGTSASSEGLVLMEGNGYGSFLGNPLLQQWVKIPSCPYEDPSVFGLVTRLDEDRVVLSFKVVMMLRASSTYKDFCIYSSETGIWTSKRIHCPPHIHYQDPMCLNGKIYLLSQIDFELPDPGVLLVHDFYSECDEYQVIPLPDHSNQKYKTALSTSGGFVTYIKTLGQEIHDVLKVWRLHNNDECWQLLWKIRLTFIKLSDIGYYAPMATHPFDSDIVYIWSQKNRYLVSCNLRTQNYRDTWYDNDDHQDCFVNQSIVEEYMDCSHRSSGGYGAAVALSQFVLPRWMKSVPCPPQVEMMDTISLHSHIASIHKSKRDKGIKEFLWI